MLHGRKRLITVLTGIAVAAGVGIVPASPSYAKPDIDHVKTRVDTLYKQAEQASERYNTAKIAMASLKRDLLSLKTDQGKQRTVLDHARGNVEDSIVRQYEGQGISAAGQVVVSPNPSDFLSQLTTMSAYNDMQTGLFDTYSTQLQALNVRSKAVKDRADEVAKTEKKLAADKAEIDKKAAAAKELLGKLQAKERAAVEAASRGGSTTRLPTNVPVSGRAAAAVHYAMAQVGKAYVWGAAGPSAFDCSGLMMAAWAQAGVGLPHSSSAQQGSGTPVSESQLKPGDLVFYYSPVSHVGMYIGGGQIVNAENPSVGVVVTGLHTMPYSGAVRPG